MKIGDRIKILRILNGLSMDSLSIRAETVNRISMSAYECNQYYPSRNKVVIVAKTLSVTASYLDYGKWDKDLCLVWRPSERKQGGFKLKTKEILSQLLPDLISETAFNLFAKIKFVDGVAVLFGYERLITCAAFISDSLTSTFPGTEILVSDKKIHSGFHSMILNVTSEHGYMIHPNLSAILKTEEINPCNKHISTINLVKAALNIAALKRQKNQGIDVDFDEAIDVLCRVLD